MNGLARSRRPRILWLSQWLLAAVLLLRLAVWPAWMEVMDQL